MCLPFTPKMKSQTTFPHFLLPVIFIIESSSLSHLLAFCCFQRLKNNSLLLNPLPSLTLHPLLAFGQWHKIMCQPDWANRCPDNLAKHYSHPGFSLISLASVFLMTWQFWGSLVRGFTEYPSICQPIAAIILICVQTDRLMAMGAFSRFASKSFWIILGAFDMPLLSGKTN